MICFNYEDVTSNKMSISKCLCLTTVLLSQIGVCRNSLYLFKVSISPFIYELTYTLITRKATNMKRLAKSTGKCFI